MTNIQLKPLAILCSTLAALGVSLSLVVESSRASQPVVVPAGGGSSPNPGILGGNRHAVMGVDQMGIGSEGVFKLDGPNSAASIRFRSQGRRLLEKVWFFYRSVGTPGPVRIHLQLDDGNGRPVPGAPINAVDFTPHAAAPLGEWHEVDIVNPWFVQAGSVNHLIIEPASGADANDHIEIISARSRFPVPIQKHVGLAPSSAVQSAFFDTTALMLDDDTTAGNGFVAARGVFKAFTPIFLFEFTRGQPFGQPYNLHQEYSIHGDLSYGQAVELRSPTQINWIASFVRGWGFTGDGEPLGDLELRIYRVDLTGEGLLHTQLVALRTDNLFRGRSHWFGTYIPTMTLDPGPDVEYYFMLSSPGSVQDEGYVYSMSNSDHPLPSNTLPTFEGVRSRSIVSPDNGQTFQTLSFKGDSAFMYGYFDPQEPFAVHDETGGHTACAGGTMHFPDIAEPGQPLSFVVWARNIGTVSQDGELYARLIDASTGLPVIDTRYIGLAPNTETATLVGASFDLFMPSTDLRLLLETGHLVGQDRVADDWTPMEIRVDTSCP
ncbi:MAG: hypothetical protein GY711_28145 [bacterium]|nr:hypothetical protein [bacterium]